MLGEPVSGDDILGGGGAAGQVRWSSVPITGHDSGPFVPFIFTQDPFDVFQPMETVEQGKRTADDHLNVAVAEDGTMFVATKNSVDRILSSPIGGACLASRRPMVELALCSSPGCPKPSPQPAHCDAGEATPERITLRTPLYTRGGGRSAGDHLSPQSLACAIGSTSMCLPARSAGPPPPSIT